MIYVFRCISKDHSKDEPREFEQIFHGIPAGKLVDQCSCSCGAIAKRAFDKEIPTQSVVGVIPISHASTGKGSLQNEVGFAFGRFARNPDGSIDKNNTRFKDSGELTKYMNGHNEIGEPVVDDRGEPIKRKDGTLMRRGAKLFKYGANSTPSKSDNPRPEINPRKRGAKWVSGRTAESFGAINTRDALRRGGVI